MAIYPASLPAGSHTVNGEKEIFLKAAADPFFTGNHCYLFHSLRIAETGYKKVGEVDFVYLDNEVILFLEVKGGKNRYDSLTNQWWLLNGTETGDPFRQVADYLFLIRNKFAREVLTEFRFHKRLLFGYGVLFPHTALFPDFRGYQKKSNHFGYTIEYAPGILYTCEDHLKKDGFREYIRHLKAYWAGYSNGDAGRAGITDFERHRIREFFRKDLVFDIPANYSVTRDDGETAHYTDIQLKVIEGFSRVRNLGIMVSGGPGSGKTLLAIHKAGLEAAAGKKVLFVCFNRLVTEYIRSRLQEDNLTQDRVAVCHIHRLYGRMLKEGNIFPQRGGESEDEYYNRKLPLAAAGYLRENSLSPPYDYLIVDEAQDLFNEYHFEVLNLLLKGGFDSGNWSIFMDALYQRVYSDRFSEEYFGFFSEVYLHIPYELTINCRNAKGIGRLAHLHSGLPEQVFLKPAQEDTWKLIKYASEQDLFNKIDTEVNLLTGDPHRVPADKITVLMPRNQLNSFLKRNNSRFRELTDENLLTDKGRVGMCTPQAFKGLENNIIIYAGVNSYSPEDPGQMAALYVAYTRARTKLILILQENTADMINNTAFYRS